MVQLIVLNENMLTKQFLTVIVFCTFVDTSLGRKGFGPGEQEWGHVNVRANAHMFWWLYYTTADVSYEEKPLIIWLQGGPGVSGTAYGNFEELGPLDTKLRPRNHTWVKDYNVLFIDNPVGTGFSYVEADLKLLAKDNEQIAKDLLACVRVFFVQFPKFLKVPTYVLAESYGGKMTVEFAYLWHEQQKKGVMKTNFKGIGLVDSLISSNDMYKSIAPYMFNFGVIDSDGYKAIDNAADRFVNASAEGDWIKAVKISNEIEYLMQNYTYHVDRYNIIKRVEPNYRAVQRLGLELSPFVYTDELRKLMKKVKVALNLQNDWGKQESAVSRALFEDSRKPVVHFVEKLLNETDIKVYIFNGQLDLIINTPGTLSWIEKLHWKHSREWLKSRRLPLVVDNIIEGYYKGYGNLKFFWVNRSGHMIPADNPVAMKPILRDLIYGNGCKKNVH